MNISYYDSQVAFLCTLTALVIWGFVNIACCLTSGSRNTIPLNLTVQEEPKIVKNPKIVNNPLFTDLANPSANSRENSFYEAWPNRNQYSKKVREFQDSIRMKGKIFRINFGRKLIANLLKN